MARSQRRAHTPPRTRLILDAGAVIALARGDDRARAVIATAREAGVEVSIPSVVVAETVRGSERDAAVNRVIRAVGEVTAPDERVGRIAGALLGAARSTSTVDALVVASAIHAGGGVVLTGDPDDLGPLANEHPDVLIRSL